jgi:hypothetical protein
MKYTASSTVIPEAQKLMYGTEFHEDNFEPMQFQE